MDYYTGSQTRLAEKTNTKSKKSVTPIDHQSSMAIFDNTAKMQFSALTNLEMGKKIVNSYDLTRQIAILTTMVPFLVANIHPN